jgi:hypothetical protein
LSGALAGAQAQRLDDLSKVPIEQFSSQPEMSAWTKAATPRKTGQPRQSCRSVNATELESAVLLQQILVLYESHWFLLFNVTNAALTAFVLRDLLPVRMFVGDLPRGVEIRGAGAAG